MARKFITLRHRLKSFLEKDELLRDSDFKLMAQVWYQDLMKIGIDPKNISGYQLLEILSHHKLSNPHTISRTRRKVQAENPNLRSEKK